MSRNTWTIEIDNTLTGSWTDDGTIYRPNSDTSIDRTSNQRKINLADGTQAFVLPETKYQKETVRLVWLEIPNSDTFRSKIETYVENADYLRITDHLSSTYIGRFIFVRRIWLLGVEDTYDLEAGFQVTEL